MSRRTSKCTPDKTIKFFDDLEKQIEVVLQATASERIEAGDLYAALESQIKKAKAGLQKE